MWRLGPSVSVASLAPAESEGNAGAEPDFSASGTSQFKFDQQLLDMFAGEESLTLAVERVGAKVDRPSEIRTKGRILGSF